MEKKALARYERRWMVDAIRKHLLPALHEIGFETVPLTDEENQGQIRQSCPFGRLRRQRAGSFDVIDIYMDKYGDPAFSMGAGVVPAEGITQPAAGHWPAEKVWASHLPTSYGVYRIPWLLRQFAVERWPWQKISQSDVTEMVASLATILPLQIDAALHTGRCGRYIRKPA
jgi:hypothetical protein